MHAAWCWSKGLIPYKDFFEHHTPWYYALLRQLLRWFHVDNSFDGAHHFLLLARVVSLALAAGSLALVTRIGRTWESRRVGLLAAFLLITQPFFFKKNVELRPDVLGLPFFLASLWALLRGLSPELSIGWRRRSWFVFAGLCLGGAAMCTQKMLFVLPGVLAGLGLWVLVEERWARTRGRRTVPARVPAAGNRDRRRVCAAARRRPLHLQQLPVERALGVHADVAQSSGSREPAGPCWCWPAIGRTGSCPACFDRNGGTPAKRCCSACWCGCSWPCW